MMFEQTGLPDKPLIRKAFKVLNDGVQEMLDQHKDQIEQQINMMKDKIRERNGGMEIPPQQEAMLEAQIRDQVSQQMDMPMQLAATAAHIILDNAAETDASKKETLAAAAIAGMAAASLQNTDSVLDELPTEVSTPAYEYWQASKAVQGGQSFDFAYSEVSPETRTVALAHLVNQAIEMHKMTRQMLQVQAMTGDVPAEVAVSREALVNLREGAKFLGEADAGIKAVFDEAFQETSDIFAKSQAFPPPRPRPGQGGIRVMSL